MRLKTLLLTALAAGALLTACQADDIPGPDAKEIYTREFIKKFGVFDPNHDWNMATQATVTVTAARPTEVKVYADVDGVRYLFGTFKGVTGTRTLSVDVPKGIAKLIVSAAGHDHEVAPGASLSLGSRLITEGDDNMLKWGPSRHRMLPTVGLKQYLDQYPEGKPNLGNTQTSFYFEADGKEHTFYPFYWNTDKAHALGIYYIPDPGNPDKIVMQDLYFTKSGELKYAGANVECNPAIPKGTSYEAGEVHLFGAKKYTAKDWQEIGVFPGIYLVEDNIANPMGTDYSGNPKQTDWPDLLYKNGEKVFKDGEIHLYNEENAVLRTAHGYISRILFKNYAFVLSETVLEPYAYPADFEIAESGFTATDPNAQGPAYQDGADHITARGVTYSLPKGTLYGFYIKCGYSGGFFNEKVIDGEKVCTPKPDAEQDYVFTAFSQATRNRDYVDDRGRNDKVREHNWTEKSWWDDEKFTELDKYAYASWGQVEMGGRTYSMFGFEDWEAGNPNSNADLNDVMFLFESGETPTTVIIEKPTKPFIWILAAEDLGVTDFDFNDVVFGVTEPVTDMETGKKTVDIIPLAAGGTLPVYLHYNGGDPIGGGEFHSLFEGDHSSSRAINVGGYSAQAKGPFTIEVKDDFSLACCKTVDAAASNMGGFTITVEKDREYEGNIITAPNTKAGVTEAPQMICVGVNWYWPKEGIYIGTPYAKFEEWCINPDACTDWHIGSDVPDEHKGKVVKHNYVGNSGNQGGNQGGETPGPDNPDKPITPAGDVLTPTIVEHPLWGSAENWKVKYELSQEVLTKIAGATSVKLKFYCNDKISHCQIGTTENGTQLENGYGGKGLPSEIRITASELNTNTIWACFFGCPEENFNITVSLVIE